MGGREPERERVGYRQIDRECLWVGFGVNESK